MGTWGVGPFDNDSAADWCGDLDDADPADRAALIRQALRDAAEEPEYLDVDQATPAVAAAAVVASQRPGGTALDSAYAPTFLTEGGRLELPDDLPALAVRAIDRILGDDSEWRELWAESDLSAEAVAVLERLRTFLAGDR